ncbi:hypothetical protein P12x_005873 [Tundrisphaera lichenicola]|uniref:hypothetical protein n=1 Tax=Tundrisphaera lichenicola TaxID=2029860 RepID=UPI003EBCFE22
MTDGFGPGCAIMDDAHVYKVNEVIALLDRLHGQTIRIAGGLGLGFEGVSIWHIPKSECLPGYSSSLWADFDLDAIGYSLEQLGKFNARHVVVAATVNRDHQGHFSLWPASVLIRSITKG